MEQHGVLRSWNDHKGFGFIRSNDSDYFVHISNVHGEQRPLQGETVYFAAGHDKQGRLRAQHVRSAEQSSAQASQQRTSQAAAASQPTHTANNPTRALSLLIVACALPAIGIWQAFAHGAALWPLLLYVCMSLFSVLQYWCDKHNAQLGQWRIPEKQLHAVALLGGWPGALVAQQLMRHKPQKASFQGLFWLIVALHQVYWLDQLVFAGQGLQQLLSIV